MFGKKPSAPPPAQSKPQAPAQPQPQAAAARPSGWAAQALTADYLASGYLQPVDMPLAGFLNVSTQGRRPTLHNGRHHFGLLISDLLSSLIGFPIPSEDIRYFVFRLDRHHVDKGLQ